MSDAYNKANARAQKAEVKCKQLRAELERLRAERDAVVEALKKADHDLWGHGFHAEGTVRRDIQAALAAAQENRP